MKTTLETKKMSFNLKINSSIFVLLFLSTLGFYAQNTSSHTGKESIRQAYGITSKSTTKNTFDSLTGIQNYTSSNRTNVCSPETSVIITESTQWGITRSTINNGDLPSFCLSYGDSEPKEDDIYFTTLTPAADISFNNSSLSNTTIINKVQRVISIKAHNSFAPSSSPSSLTDNFYKSIAVVIWHYTNNLDLSNLNYPWTGADGNAYTTNDLKQWVSNGTLQPSDAIWLLPENNTSQPEVLLNKNTSSNCCPTPPSLDIATITPTNNNGAIKINSGSGAQYYGVSSLNASSYDGPTTIATATELPTNLPTTIVSNVSNYGGQYIIRAFTNIDGCFTDYSITVPQKNGIDCTSSYGNYESDINNVVGKHNISGAPDGNYAEIHNSNQQLIIDFNQTFPAGTQYKITWKVRSGVNGTAYIDLSESESSNSGFTSHPIKPETSSNNFITTTVTSNTSFRYLAFDKGEINNTDYDIDTIEVISCVACDVANNTTTSASITEEETKTLSGTPAGGTWSIVSGGGAINNGMYTPSDINTDTTVVIRYAIAADGDCAATTDDVTFTVTPVCDVVADNTTSTTSITEAETKTLSGTPAGGTFSIVSGGGAINNGVYTPDNINGDTNVTIKYTIAADGDCTATSDNITFSVKVLPSVVVTKTDVTCYGLDDGSITFTFDDATSRTYIEFSLDGGNTYKTQVSDASGSVSYSNLQPGSYDVWARWGNDEFPIDLGTDIIISEPTEVVVNNTTASASITEAETKTLSGTPAGGTWSIVSGGGSIAGSTYTPSDINTDTTVVIRYTIAADGDCAATSDDVTFTVTPVCDVVADNTTGNASITEAETKTLTGSPAGGIFSIISGGGTINNGVYTPSDINTDTTVVIRYTIAADGDCAATTDDVTFTVTPVCDVVADNTTGNASITEGETKTLSGTPAGGTFSIVSGGGAINNGVYTPSDINTDTTVVIRYTIAADGDCAATTDDVTFTVTPVCDVVADNTTATTSITEAETKTLSGTPAGGTFSIVSGGGAINNGVYTPSDINTDTTVVIRYTIDADGDCAATTDDVTFTVTPVCDVVADNTTATTSITEAETKTLTGSPAGGIFSIISGGGSIAGSTYTPSDINTDTTVVIRYTIAADGDCAATTDDVTFTVTPVCDVVADNTTANTSITEAETKTLSGTPSGGSFSIVSGGGTINNGVYRPSDINTDTTVVIRYTIPADGDCAATTDDVTFTVTPVCDVVADNTTSTTSITEGETKTLTGSPAGGTFSIVSGGGSIVGSTYTPSDINTDTTVVIRYTIAADGDCAATTDDVTFTVTPVITVPTVTQNFESGDRNIESAECWGFGGFTIKDTDKINGDFSARSGSINSTNGAFWLKSPWIELASGTINFDIKLNNTDNQDYYVEISFIPFDPTENNGEGTPKTNIYTHTLQSPLSDSETVSYTIPTNLANDGNPYKVRLNVYNQNGNRNRRAIIDDWSIPGVDVSVSSNNCLPTSCTFANNTTANASITEAETKTLSGTPAGGTFSIVSGGGSIVGSTYTPSDINTDTTVVIRYAIATNGSCAGTTDDVTFTVTPVCDVVADNTTANASITEAETKALTGSPAGGTFSIVSGGGTINNGVYTPSDINTDTSVVIRYTIAADGDCAATTDDITFTVTPVLGSIGDTVWYDENRNAIKDASENGLEGATVTLDPGTPGDTSDDITTTTDANGNYLFENLIAGTYRITVDVSTITSGIPSGFTISDLIQTFDKDGLTTLNTSSVNLAPEENNLVQDFGYVGDNGFGSIGDTVWYDEDGDAIKDSTENGLGGAIVTLDPGTPGDTSDDITTTTDANGNYLFENLTAGIYTISVDVSTVTSGIPSGKVPSDLEQTFDNDNLGSPNNSTVNLGSGEDNVMQDFAYVVPTGGTSGGNSGGVESESLGDAISKIYVGRKKNSVPTEFVKTSENLYDKAALKKAQPYQGKGQTLLDMFPTELYAGNIANVTSPTDILDYTVADEVLSVDFSLNGETKGVVLGIKTSDKIYNHTKASCDRLRGAEILNIQKVQLDGYNFLMQGIKQRNGEIEYAISFAVAKNNNDVNYTIQTNWYVNNYIKFNDVYNFQVWSTRPMDTQKLVKDILNNLKSFIPVSQTEKQKFPKTYASKIYRDKGELVIALRSTEEGKTADISMVELYSETANNIKHRHNSVTTEIQQNLKVAIADGYEYDALIKVEDEVEDAFYHADGNWGLDYDSRYTEIKNYFIWNDFNREYLDDEYTINRSVEIQATSEYDYLTIYKSLLPGTISADYSAYNYVSFKAKGSGLIELGLLKASIEDWTAQYRVMVNLSEEEQTYYVPFDIFTSSASQENLTAEDLTTLLFTFLPVEAQTKELDLMISDVKFTKLAVEDQIVNKIEKFENEFMAYPNPSQGNVNLLLFSEVDTEATVTLTDITGKTIYKENVNLNSGKNELDFNFKVKTGVMLLKVASKENNYGTSKIIFR